MSKKKQPIGIKKITTITISLFIVIFALQNIEMTEVKFLFWKITISRVLIILGSFTIGVLVGGYVKKWFRKAPINQDNGSKSHPWQA
ncbi:hypothetical protein MWU59_00440 [Flavobacteriaceae bacterium F08102]|nr:hypothetical protein [Flavobacteriaceae bacterium F08102]